jgi:hypothetical protein
MSNRLLKFLLKRQFKKHKEKWHFPEGCVFCHVDPPYQERLFK